MQMSHTSYRPALRANLPIAQPNESLSIDASRLGRVGFVGKNTAGCWTALQEGLRRRGIASDVIAESDHPFQYGNSVVREPHRVRALLRTESLLRRLAQSRILRSLSSPLAVSGAWLADKTRSRRQQLFANWLASRYDTIFIGRGSALSLSDSDVDFPSLKERRLIFVAFGSDLRSPMLNGATFPSIVPGTSKRMEKKQQAQLRLVQAIKRLGATIIATPGTSHYLTDAFIDREVLGFPVLERDPSLYFSHSKEVSVVHVPSNTSAKGTREILSTVNAVHQDLRESDVSFAFRILNGVTQSSVMAALADADVVIDQLYCDQYAGVLAREALYHGLPVIIGSHDAEWLNRQYSERIPFGIILIHPEGLEAALGETIQNISYWRQKRHDIAESFRQSDGLDLVTTKWLKSALGEYETSWLFNPGDLNVALGGFCDRAHRSRLVWEWVRANGAPQFEANGKAELQAAVMRLLGS